MPKRELTQKEIEEIERLAAIFERLGQPGVARVFRSRLPQEDDE